jgi:hypothetical protein
MEPVRDHVSSAAYDGFRADPDGGKTSGEFAMKKSSRAILLVLTVVTTPWLVAPVVAAPGQYRR